MGILSRLAGGSLLLLASLAAFAADPVAFISDMKGEVLLDGAGRPAFLAELLPGSKLVLGSGAAASVMYVVSGDEYGLNGPGEFVVTKEGVKAAKGSPPTRRTAPLRPGAAVVVQTSKAAMASLRMRSAPVAKAEGKGPQYPANGKIATLQPALRWGGDPAQTYTVLVTSVSGKEVYRGSAKGPSLKLPERLVPGQTYVWTVSVGAAALGDARFETLPADSIQAAEKARSGARTFQDRVLVALLLEELGASPDAREIWGQLAAERPDIPELAGLAR
jgi:hypothetical protein